jgi:hypothetical protein
MTSLFGITTRLENNKETLTLPSPLKRARVLNLLSLWRERIEVRVTTKIGCDLRSAQTIILLIK